MPKNTGKNFEYEFSRSLRDFAQSHPDFWWSRWPDYQDFSSTSHYRANKAPADFIALYKGQFHAYECKSSVGTRFNLEWVKPHQYDSLMHLKRCGALSFIAFSLRTNPDIHRSKARCFLIDISDYSLLQEKCIEADMASIPLENIEMVGIELKPTMVRVGAMKRRGRGWSLPHLLSPQEILSPHTKQKRR